ncbi:MAG: hypothetical protein WDZ88_02360 [Candidatus Paceibacterota bacterium]
MEEKENQKLWFKRKWYGWGWYPSSIEGWITTLLYIGFIFYLSTRLEEGMSTMHLIGVYFLPLLVITVVFITIAYAKGESPKWQWGRPKEEGGVKKEEHEEQKIEEGN